MQKISPFLWFEDHAEEAVSFYTSLFDDSRIVKTLRYPENSTVGTPGSVMAITFELEGQEFLALNGGPEFTFSEAVSFQVMCEDQDEVDLFWSKLGEGGEHGPCGWLKDRFGLSWQIVPTRLGELLGDPDPARAQRAMTAMLGMKKLEIAELEQAADGAG
jgi:predicted 3-demethylubiquinone-9 3-methyltransferase (glyoxalase superfamily)